MIESNYEVPFQKFLTRISKHGVDNCNKLIDNNLLPFYPVQTKVSRLLWRIYDVIMFYILIRMADADIWSCHKQLSSHRIARVKTDGRKNPQHILFFNDTDNWWISYVNFTCWSWTDLACYNNRLANNVVRSNRLQSI